MLRTITLSLRVSKAERDAMQKIADDIGYGCTVAGILYQMVKDAIAQQEKNPLHTRRVWEEDQQS